MMSNWGKALKEELKQINKGGCMINQSEPMKETQVAKEFIMLQSATDELKNKVYDLKGRLNTVLLPKDETLKDCCGETPRAVLCPLADGIRVQSDNVFSALNVLKEIIERLEL